MKRCSKCGLEKDESEFYKKRRDSDALRSMCKMCFKLHNKTYLVEHCEENKIQCSEYHRSHRERARIYRHKRHLKDLEKLWSLKTHCVKCGETRKCSIDFHHIDPSKKLFEVSTKKDYPFEILKSEAEKCVCLCRNCHSEFHFIYGAHPLKPKENLQEYLEG